MVSWIVVKSLAIRMVSNSVLQEMYDLKSSEGVTMSH